VRPLPTATAAAPKLTSAPRRTTKIENLEENLGALKVQLTPDEVAAIRQAVDAAGNTGARYPAQYAPNPIDSTGGC